MLTRTVQEGEGRVLFADGTEHVGVFSEDRMREISTRDAPDVPTVDIPVKLHLDDLLPDPTARAAALREIYIVLSRFASTLRAVYRQYAMQGRAADDPDSMLSVGEMLQFCMDIGLNSRGLTLGTATLLNCCSCT